MHREKQIKASPNNNEMMKNGTIKDPLRNPVITNARVMTNAVKRVKIAYEKKKLSPYAPVFKLRIFSVSFILFCFSTTTYFKM
jgi:hypothetical protein